MLRRQVVLGAILSLVVLVVCSAPAGAQPTVSTAKTQRQGAPLRVVGSQAVGPSSLQRTNGLLDHGGGSDDQFDSGAAIDISDVFAYNVGTTGNIAFEIYAYSGNFTDGDFVQVYINSDNNFVTGEAVTGGADYLIQIQWSGGSVAAYLFLWTGSWQGIATNLQFDVYPADGAIVVVIHNGELGNTQAFTFFVRTWNGSDSDDAPNGSLVYNFAFDFIAPKSVALRSACAKPCAKGARPRLNYKFRRFEDYTQEQFKVRTSRGRLLYNVRSEFGSNDPDTEYWDDGFRMPRRPVGWLSFCVRSFDLSGNTTRFDCNKLVLPRIDTDAKLDWENDGRTITSIRMVDLPRNTLVTIDCVRGCSAHERKTVSRRFNSVVFRGFSAPVGAQIVARATHPRWVGYYEKFTRHSIRPFWPSFHRCMPPGLRTPTRRCA